MTCLRCDGKGTYRNEFGLMEKCESCQRADMSLEKITPEPDPDEEGYWEKREEKLIFTPIWHQYNHQKNSILYWLELKLFFLKNLK